MLHCYPEVNSFFQTINELLWNFSVQVQVKSHPVDTLNKVIIIIIIIIIITIIIIIIFTINIIIIIIIIRWALSSSSSLLI